MVREDRGPVDILLVQPPVNDFYLTAKRTIPYGLASIAAALQRERFSVEIFDALATAKSKAIPLPDAMGHLAEHYGRPDVSPFSLFHGFRHFGLSFEALGAAVLRSGAFLVGISSLFTAYAGEAIRCAQIAKAALPGCKVVLGGHHPTAMPEKPMESEAVDFVIRGDGEIGMPALAHAIRSGLPIERVPGIVFRKGDRSLHLSPPAFGSDLAAYPLPASELLNARFYRRGKRGSIVTITSRGCPLRCSYCALGSAQIAYRARPLAAVMAEIEAAVDSREVGFIDFEDEQLACDKAFFLALLREIGRRFGDRRIELRAMNGLFPPFLDGEIIAEMRRAGFKTLNLSLGSASDAQQRRFRRRCPGKAFDRAIEEAAKNGLDAVSYIIVGAPDQDPEESVRDLIYLAERRTLAGVSVFYPAPGSADFDRCRELGLLPRELCLMRSSALPIDHTTSRTDAVTLLRLGRIVNFMKSLIDGGTPLPAAHPWAKTGQAESGDRRRIGLLLLQSFLYDGRIRGMTDDGEVYEHRISPRLTGCFLRALDPRAFRGATDVVA